LEPLSVFRGFGVPLFSLEVFFEPMSEGSDSAPLLMASLCSAWVLVEYEANLISDFDQVRCFRGNEAFIAASGYMGSASLKTSRPRWLPL
jgi:hypothetical protein